ncbi:hypothetical protein [Pararobbsia alpina]|uniref:hypothetical protein n=1 Tax=Pararobbsia alpina TaxID=621374 RepID=UPI0039A4BBFB
MKTSFSLRVALRLARVQLPTALAFSIVIACIFFIFGCALTASSQAGLAVQGGDLFGLSAYTDAPLPLPFSEWLVGGLLMQLPWLGDELQAWGLVLLFALPSLASGSIMVGRFVRKHY